MIISIESELRKIESIQSNRNAPKNERKIGVNMIRVVSNSNYLIVGIMFFLNYQCWEAYFHKH